MTLWLNKFARVRSDRSCWIVKVTVTLHSWSRFKNMKQHGWVSTGHKFKYCYYTVTGHWINNDMYQGFQAMKWNSDRAKCAVVWSTCEKQLMTCWWLEKPHQILPKWASIHQDIRLHFIIVCEPLKITELSSWLDSRIKSCPSGPVYTKASGCILWLHVNQLKITELSNWLIRMEIIVKVTIAPDPQTTKLYEIYKSPNPDNAKKSEN